MYGYCLNNPVSNFDATGYLSKKVCMPESFGNGDKSPWYPPLKVERRNSQAQKAEQFFFEMIAAKNPIDHLNQNTDFDKYTGGTQMVLGLRKIRKGFVLIVTPVPTLADELLGIGYIMWGFSSVISGLDPFC